MLKTTILLRLFLVLTTAISFTACGRKNKQTAKDKLQQQGKIQNEAHAKLLLTLKSDNEFTVTHSEQSSTKEAETGKTPECKIADLPEKDETLTVLITNESKDATITSKANYKISLNRSSSKNKSDKDTIFDKLPGDWLVTTIDDNEKKTKTKSHAEIKTTENSQELELIITQNCEQTVESKSLKLRR